MQNNKKEWCDILAGKKNARKEILPTFNPRQAGKTIDFSKQKKTIPPSLQTNPKRPWGAHPPRM